MENKSIELSVYRNKFFVKRRNDFTGSQKTKDDWLFMKFGFVLFPLLQWFWFLSIHLEKKD